MESDASKFIVERDETFTQEKNSVAVSASKSFLCTSMSKSADDVKVRYRNDKNVTDGSAKRKLVSEFNSFDSCLSAKRYKDTNDNKRYQAQVTVGNRKFIGYGRSNRAAQVDASVCALKSLRLWMPRDDVYRSSDLTPAAMHQHETSIFKRLEDHVTSVQNTVNRISNMAQCQNVASIIAVDDVGLRSVVSSSSKVDDFDLTTALANLELGSFASPQFYAKFYNRGSVGGNDDTLLAQSNGDLGPEVPRLSKMFEKLLELCHDAMSN